MSLSSNIRDSVEREKFWRAREFFLEEGAIKQSDHCLRTGSKADYYFDIDYLLNDPYKCRMISSIYVNIISNIAAHKKIDLLAFIEKASGGTIGALRLAATISMATMIPNIVVRPNKSILFEKIKVPFLSRGEIGVHKGLKNFNTIIVTDHCSTGYEVVDVKKILASKHAEVSDAVCYTCRGDLFDAEGFEENGLTLHSAYSLPGFGRMPRNVEELGNIAVNF